VERDLTVDEHRERLFALDGPVEAGARDAVFQNRPLLADGEELEGPPSPLVRHADLGDLELLDASVPVVDGELALLDRLRGAVAVQVDDGAVIALARPLRFVEEARDDPGGPGPELDPEPEGLLRDRLGGRGRGEQQHGEDRGHRPSHTFDAPRAGFLPCVTSNPGRDLPSSRGRS
jgi:hypothetical protein